MVKKDKLDIPELFINALEKHPQELMRVMSEEMVKKERFPREEITKIIGDGFAVCLAGKLKDLSGYFHNGYQQYFSDNLTSTYDRVLKQYFVENKAINAKVEKMVKNHLKSMDFERVVMEFINNKRELVMEMMVKNLFTKDNKNGK